MFGFSRSGIFCAKTVYVQFELPSEEIDTYLIENTLHFY
jgi:hypothetical protein